MSSAARLAGAVVVAVCVARAAIAESGATPASISVVAGGCGAGLPEARELPDRLAVELAPVRVEAGVAAVLEVATSCTAVESITLRRAANAREGEAATLRTRAVSLEDVAPNLRAVALAVLTAEFLRSTWANASAPAGTGAPGAAATPAASALPGDSAMGSMQPAPSATATAAPPATPAPVAAPPTAPEQPKPPEAPSPKTSPAADRPPEKAPQKSRFRLGAAALFRWFSRPPSVLGGAEVSVERAPWVFGANAAFNDEQNMLGNIDFGVAAVFTGARLPFARSRSLALSGVGFGEIGYTWARAAGNLSALHDGATGALFAALMLGPELDVSLSRVLGLTLGVHAGVARGLSITSDRSETVGTQGLAITSSVGLRYAP